MKTRLTRMAMTAISALVLVSLTGCDWGGSPDIWIDEQRWFSSYEILQPFEISGDGPTALAYYTIESQWMGTDWFATAGTESGPKEIRVPSGSWSMLQFNLPSQPDFDEPDYRYRVTFQVMSTRSGGAVSLPILTREWEFQVDTQRPDPGNMMGGMFGPSEGSMLIATGDNTQRIFYTDDFFFNPFGESPVRVHYTTDGSTPTPLSPSIHGTDDSIKFQWQPGDGDVEIRLLPIDEAGNQADWIRSIWYWET